MSTITNNINKLINNLNTVNISRNTKNEKYFDAKFDVVDSDQGVTKQQLEDRVNQLLDTYIPQADLYAKDTLDLLEHVRKVLGVMSPVYDRVLNLSFLVEYIRRNQVPPDCIIITKEATTKVSPSVVPEGTSFANIVIDSHRKDNACEEECLSVLSDQLPLICSSRTFMAIMPRLAKMAGETSDWWFFKNQLGNLIVCLPKMEGDAATYLRRLGYANTLVNIIWTDLQSQITTFDKQSEEDYQQSLAEQIPLLFAADVRVKRRFHFLGHGGLSSSLISVTTTHASKGIKDVIGKIFGEGSFAGLKISQMKTVLQQLDKLGLEYLNCVTCFGGGHNLMEIFHGMKHRFIVSVCSTDEYPVLAYQEPDSVIRIRHRNHALFWQKIHHVLALKEPPRKAFRNALEHIYGNTLTGIPSLSMPGRAFRVVNVRNQVQMLTYQRLAKLSSITVNRLFCIYPQIVTAPVILQRRKETGSFAPIISKIPGHNQVMLMEVRTKDGTPEDVVKEALMERFSDMGSSWNQTTWATQLVCVKEIQGVAKDMSPLSYRKVVFLSEPFRGGCYRYLIFQKEIPNKWFFLDVVKNCHEIDPEAATTILYERMTKLHALPEAIDFAAGNVSHKQTHEDFIKCYREQFLKCGQVDLVSAFELIECNQLKEFSDFVVRLTPRQRREILFRTTQQGKVEFLQAMRGLDCQIREKNWDNNSVLSFAVKFLDQDIATQLVRVLLELGANPSDQDRVNRKPIFDAITLGNLECVELLAAASASIDDGFDGDTLNNPIGHSITCNRLDMVEILLKYQPDLSIAVNDKEDVRSSKTILAAVLEKGHRDLAVKMMTEHNAPCIYMRDIKTAYGTYCHGVSPPTEQILKQRDDDLFGLWLLCVRDELQNRVKKDNDWECWDDSPILTQHPPSQDILLFNRVVTHLRNALQPYPSLLTSGMKKHLIECLDLIRANLLAVSLPPKYTRADADKLFPKEDEFEKRYQIKVINSVIPRVDDFRRAAITMIDELIKSIT